MIGWTLAIAIQSCKRLSLKRFIIIRTLTLVNSRINTCFDVKKPKYWKTWFVSTFMVSMYFNDFSQISLNLSDWIFDIDNDGVHDTVTTDFHLTYFLTLDASHRRLDYQWFMILKSERFVRNLYKLVPERLTPENLTHFRDFEGTKNASLFPGRLYQV